jgi:hypothetical protein
MAFPSKCPPSAKVRFGWLRPTGTKRTNKWTTSFCQRTKPAAQAEEDLRVLRAWVLGQSLPAQVTGEVWNPAERRNLAGIPVYLRGGAQTLSTTIDDRGQFSFENLGPGVYEAVVALRLC